MGDTYFIKKLNCAYCGKENDFDCKNDENDEMTMSSLYPGIGWTSEFGAEFICEFCREKNKVKMEFVTVKIKKLINKKSIRK